MNIIFFLHRASRGLYSRISSSINHFRCRYLLWVNDVSHHEFRNSGIPYIFIGKNGSLRIGRNFAMHNSIKGNPIGCYEKCTFYVAPGCKIEIGDNVGISQTALISYASISIGNNVKIGGGTCLWTTDFHSLDPTVRKGPDDLKNRRSLPIEICDNAFIGAKSIILKGVRIGENSIVGAGSVVTKSIPANEIWGGNPAKFIRKI